MLALELLPDQVQGLVAVLMAEVPLVYMAAAAWGPGTLNGLESAICLQSLDLLESPQAVAEHQ